MARFAYYPKYPGDFLADPKVQDLTLEQVGIYSLMLDNLWLSPDCLLPDDHVYLAKLLKIPRKARFEKIAKLILDRFFVSVPERPGYITNPRLYKEYQKACEKSAKQSAGGKATATKRWGHSLATRQDNSLATDAIIAKQHNQNQNHLILSLIPSPNPHKIETTLAIADGAVLSNGHQRATKRGSAFPEDWQVEEWMEQLCRGYAINPHSEFAHFKNHHVAKGTVFKSWPHAFRAWVLKAVKLKSHAGRS